MTRALEQLIVTWREKAENDPNYHKFIRLTLRSCADDLEAALALPGEPEDDMAKFEDDVIGAFSVEEVEAFKEDDSLCGCGYRQSLHRVGSEGGVYCLIAKLRHEANAALPGGRESKEEKHRHEFNAPKDGMWYCVCGYRASKPTTPAPPPQTAQEE
jgi:hypothetical protein